MMEQLNTDLFGQVLPTIPLVYRMSHKSTDLKSFTVPDSKKFNVKLCCSVSPRAINTYHRNVADNRVHNAMSWEYSQTITTPVMPVNNKSYGIMSYKGSSNINNKIDWMLLITKEKDAPQQKFSSNYKWKINMLTLTLSSKQVHSDKVIKSRLLNHFLVILHRTFEVKNFIWRAETQANGNVHFHIITDVFIPYKLAQWHWNKIQNKLGYIDKFKNVYGNKTPNSIDIHSIKKVKHLGKYLSKYVSKNSQGVVVPAVHTAFNPPVGFGCTIYFNPMKKGIRFFRPVSGRLWGCSATLSKLKKCTFVLPDDIEREIFRYRCNVPSSLFESDFCRTYTVSCLEYKDVGLLLVRDKLLQYMTNILTNHK
jgi:hypothetical protein